MPVLPELPGWDPEKTLSCVEEKAAKPASPEQRMCKPYLRSGWHLLALSAEEQGNINISIWL